MNTDLKNRRVTDKILTSVVMGYNLDQEFSGHHLFPDVPVTEMGGKIIAFGKEAYQVRNTKRAPGETVRSIATTYSSTDYVLNNRLLEARTPEEHVEAAASANIALKSRNVNAVMRSMRLEGEWDMAQLADNPSSYSTGHSETLSGTSLWSDPTADVRTQINDAKAQIRERIGREPNVLHIDYHGKQALQENNGIREFFKFTGQTSITDKMLAEFFDIDKVVVAKAVYTPEEEGTFQDVFARNARLAYVPPKNLQAKESPSFGYNYVGKGFPKVEKEYFEQSDRSYHNPVLFRDKAIVTASDAGFLFIGTTVA